jgi:putative endonuclease
MRYYVYIMASCSRILYVGVTGCLMVRVLRHKAGRVSAFTRKYRVHRLVYTQAFQNIGDAIARETQIKGWMRDKKLTLIRMNNPTWEDLAKGWGEPAAMQFKGKAGSSRWSE